MTRYLFVFIGGGIGAVSRYWLSGFVYKFINTIFPIGNLVVNISGCILIGFLMTFFKERFVINPELQAFLIIGVLGGFTTFSSFSYETLTLIRNTEYYFAGLNILLSLVLCLIGTYIGIVIGELI